MQYVDERPLDEVELLVCLDERGHAEGTLYEDAGDGYGYRAGQHRLTRFVAQLAGDRLEVKIASSEGAWPMPAGRRDTVRVLAEAKVLARIEVEGP